MKLLNLQASNIFSLGTDVTQNLGGRGLVLITGHSEDEGSSNGAGKSSLANKSILWTLWGETAGGLKADAVLNRHGKRKGHGSVTFTGRDGDDYRVTRKRPAELILERRVKHNVDWKDVSAKTAKDTQDLINKALGIDFKTFIQTSFFGQGRNISYPSLPPKEQKDVLEQILPMEEVDRWAIYAEAAYKEVSKLADIADRELVGLNDKQQTLKREREFAKNTAEGFDLGQQRQIREIDERLSKLDKEFANERDKLTILQAQVDVIDPVELGQRQTEITEQLEDYRTRLIAETDKQFHEANESLSQWDIRCTYLRNELKTIEGSASCPTCLRPYDNLEKVEERKATTRKLIEEATTNISLATAAVRHYRNIRDNTRSKYEELQQSRHEITNVLTQKTIAERDIKLLEGKINSTRLALLDKQVALQLQENPHTGTINRLDTELILLDQRILDANKKLGTINGEVEHLDYWREVYAKELKLKLFEDACPFLDSRTAYHLERLKNNQIHVEFSTVKRLATGKAKEEFNVNVWSETGGTGFDSLSGGEQQMVSFAVGLALSDLASSVSSVSSSFLILDEPFSELDARNSEAIVEYLTSELGKGKDSIFLISNDESLKGLIPNRLHVVKRSGITNVESH